MFFSPSAATSANTGTYLKSQFFGIERRRSVCCVGASHRAAPRRAAQDARAPTIARRWQVGFSIATLRSALLGHLELRVAGCFSAASSTIGLTAAELREGGFPLQLKEHVGLGAGLREAGFTADALEDVGFTSKQLREWPRPRRWPRAPSRRTSPPRRLHRARAAQAPRPERRAQGGRLLDARDPRGRVRRVSRSSGDERHHKSVGRERL